MAFEISSVNGRIGTTRYCVVGGFALSECVYPAHFHIPRHSHDTGRFTLVLEGAITEMCGRRIREANPGVLNYLAAGDSHSTTIPAPRVRCFNLEISAQAQERVDQYSRVLDESATLQDESLIWLAHRLVRELHRGDASAVLAMEGLALELLATASRHPFADRESTAPRWLRQARELLHDGFTGDLSLNHIAQMVGVHPTHLARVFRQHYHCTVGDYLRHLRLEQACRDLAATDIPLAEIARRAGFSDQSHFSRAFRKQTGLTPRAFRKNNPVC